MNNILVIKNRDKVIFTNEKDSMEIIDNLNYLEDNLFYSQEQDMYFELIKEDFLVGTERISVFNYSNITKYYKEINELKQKITEKETKIRELEIDEVTELYNRKSTISKFNEAIKESKETQQSLSVAILDIDFFKKVNDTYGHLAGDYVLKELSNFMKIYLHIMCPNSILGRLGGEEFLIVIKGNSSQDTINILETLLKRVENSQFIYDKKIIKITCSIGLYHITKEESDTPESISELREKYIYRADKALYESKKNGRNRLTDY